MTDNKHVYALVLYDFDMDTRCAHVQSLYKTEYEARIALNELAKEYFDELDVETDDNGNRYDPDPEKYGDEAIFEVNARRVSINIDKVEKIF